MNGELITRHEREPICRFVFIDEVSYSVHVIDILLPYWFLCLLLSSNTSLVMLEDFAAPEGKEACRILRVRLQSNWK